MRSSTPYRAVSSRSPISAVLVPLLSTRRSQKTSRPTLPKAPETTIRYRCVGTAPPYVQVLTASCVRPCQGTTPIDVHICQAFGCLTPGGGRARPLDERETPPGDVETQ